MSIKKSNSQFEAELKDRNNSVKNLEPYQDARSKILFLCKECGYKWLATPDSVLRGSGCARCVGILRKSQTDIISETEKANPKIEILGEYKNNRTRILCKCRICSYEWQADPVRLRTGTNCPNCLHSGTSLVEQCIFILFEDYYGKGKVKGRNKTAIGKELDIYIPDTKIAIEFGSWFWHKSKVKNDMEKIDLCRRHNIDIVTIFDACTDEIAFPYCADNIFLYDVNLSTDNGSLKSMLERLASRFGLDKTISDEYFADIKKRAFESCSRKSTAYFQSEVYKISPNIKILGKYTRARDKIDCTCLICGHHWTPVADNLLRGQGCPNCAKEKAVQRQTLSHDEYLKRVQKKLNPNVNIIGTYIKSDQPILCRCKQCNYEWNVLPGHLHSGSGCPKCGGTMKKTHQEFVSEVKAANPEIEICGQYISHNTPIDCKCIKCGYTWSPRPKHLYNGHGCPQCAGNLKKTREEFVAELASCGFLIDVLGEYKSVDTPILLKCKTCGHEWTQRPRNLMKSRGCPSCFPYSEEQDKKWNEMYALATKYYLQYGNLLIPVRKEYCGVELGKWVYAQRRVYRNGLLPKDQQNKSLGSISVSRINLLNEINMKW